MTKGRLEAFSDGVLAIIITIMVLEMKVPHEATLESLKPLLPVLLSYVLGFINIGIYWNNHHHMLHITKQVNGSILWANMHLLFWLSLFPFTTAWMGENSFAKWPVVLFGVVSFMSGMAYYLLAHCLSKLHGKDSPLGIAIGKDRKGIISQLIYATGVAVSFINPLLGILCYFIVACMWFIPDRRIEKQITD